MSTLRLSKGFLLPPKPPKRRRNQRTVYSVEQREELESFFKNSHYPSYDERETLADRLNLKEQQVQVWFKNRRAKETRLRRGTRTRQGGPKAGASSQGPGVCASAPAPAPAPAAAGPGFPDDPVLPSGPGVAEDPVLSWELLFSEIAEFLGDSVLPGGAGPDNAFGDVAAAEPSASNHLQAWLDPAQDAQNPVPAAPAPAPAAVPVWPEGSNAGDFFADLDLTDLLSL